MRNIHPQCSIENCARRAVSRSWCAKHYTRWRRQGDPHQVGLIRGGSLSERFWCKVQKTDRCWIWTAARDSNGYGVLNVGSKKLDRAHRVSWLLHYGPIPKGVDICHNCPDGDNPSCINPAHLFMGTRKDNLQDMSAKGRSGAHRHPEATPRGEAHHQAKLTAVQVRKIRARYQAEDISMSNLAQEYQVSFSAIQALIARRHWKQLE